MKVKVNLIYDNKKDPKPLLVEIKSGLKGEHFMTAIDKAVAKAAGDDPDWKRWNLASIED